MTGTDRSTMVPQPVLALGPGAGSPLDPQLLDQLERIMVETNLHLPGMFELTFVGLSSDALKAAGVEIGAQLAVDTQVVGADAEGGERVRLIKGEVTAFEGRYEDFTGSTTVRGYDVTHRLQKIKRTRAFVNMSDSDVARQVAQDAGLQVGEITPTEVVHEHLPQYDQTDWDFLKQRAVEIGFELTVADGLFGFRKASSVDGAGPAACELAVNEDLKSFRPRVTAGNLAPSVEVRVWDPMAGTVVSAVSGTSTGSVSQAGATSPEQVAGLFGDPADGGSPPASPAVEQLGPPPSGTALVVSHRPVGSGATADSAANLLAGGLKEHLASTFAEADGDAIGNPGVQAGHAVRVTGAPSQFPETWMVTRAKHIFKLSEGGYHTEFAASGRHDRSLLGLASLGKAQAAEPRAAGVMCGVVTNVNDAKARVKVTVPGLSTGYESDWCPVVQFGAGTRSGAMFLPEVGDQVLLAFEGADPRRPYVLGGIFNTRSRYSLGGSAVQATGEAAAVVRRGFVSASGTVLAFHDELPPGDDPKPTQAQIALGTADGAVGLSIDVVKNTLVISCAAQDPPGQITIKCSNAGTVNIQAGEGGTMTVDGGDSLSIKAKTSLSIESSGQLTLKGSTISLN